MADNRMKQWREKLRDEGGAIFHVHLSKTSNDKLNSLAKKWGTSKRDVIETAISQLVADQK